MAGKPLTTSFLNGLPPHIAQVIASHRDINVTLRYKAVYPEEDIRAHLAFLARRRSLRPAQGQRIAEIRDNLITRIAEAEREGWPGEVEGLRISLAGANDKLAQIDRRHGTTVADLPTPTMHCEY